MEMDCFPMFLEGFQQDALELFALQWFRPCCGESGMCLFYNGFQQVGQDPLRFPMFIDLGLVANGI